MNPSPYNELYYKLYTNKQFIIQKEMSDQIFAILKMRLPAW
jgi:hypothetical protein